MALSSIDEIQKTLHSLFTICLIIYKPGWLLLRPASQATSRCLYPYHSSALRIVNCFFVDFAISCAYSLPELIGKSAIFHLAYFSSQLSVAILIKCQHTSLPYIRSFIISRLSSLLLRSFCNEIATLGFSAITKFIYFFLLFFKIIGRKMLLSRPVFFYTKYCIVWNNLFQFIFFIFCFCFIYFISLSSASERNHHLPPQSLQAPYLLFLNDLEIISCT